MNVTTHSGPAAHRSRAAGAFRPGLVAVGISHRTASVELLGRCGMARLFGDGELTALRERTAVAGVVALSTCNRRELYAYAADHVAAGEALTREIATMASLDEDESARVLYVHRDVQAARHLFRVTSSLDSMVVGESEIQGQVRTAWEHARRVDATDVSLDRLFRTALQVGKRVRRATRIGEGRISVPSVAVKLVEEVVGTLADRRVLIVGAGAMSRIVADAIASRGVRDVAVASRTPGSARALAQERSWRTVGMSELAGEIVGSDVVFSATTAAHPLVPRCAVQAAMAARPGRPMALIDLAVPGDIEPGVAAVRGVTLHSMEDIRRIAAASSSARRASARYAELMVAREVERFAAGPPVRVASAA